MGFQSFSEIAKQQRKGKGRTAAAPKSLLSITQKSYEDESKRSVMTIRLSSDAMDKARFKIGDKVDVAHDPSRKLWQVALAHDNQSGYSISGMKDSSVGTVRFTLYDGMATITNVKPANSSRIFSDDKSVNASAGRIIFALDEESIIIRTDSADTQEG
ncbi:hypothetical protein KS872_004550 [Vibrio parahaemolyticus]|uniref:hypothetical protein n=1 Tax=Vibrio parahaemolyticus TaxID=670 RepID=UPI002492D115|nr:hypothetical protein [Vibrio parahaemolyticus]EHR0574748.1 hypothetical protein [Vibrio parahaemolyticus]EME0114489.1 hypothetical protein [Vibrio parahaemolyticus]